MSDNGGPAFPFEYHNQTSQIKLGFFGTGNLSPGASQQFAGMSLRDYFAAKAMAALIASPFPNVSENVDVAAAAYAMADAMIGARK